MNVSDSKRKVVKTMTGSSNGVPRMRTIPEAVRLLHAMDSDCAVTVRAVRRFVDDGKLPVTHVGSKRLINFDALLRLLECPVTPVPELRSGTIRRISERGA